ncbi:MAG: (Fe-S)-binding protein [Prolixibacteraceae bacterium]|jgi:L-lactate dehydrogenase complex protein LldE|nr:(Fe-S)-binding protein [Prolixibacteraceae bacterium]MBT6999145.1 (Fe-S)-binding protein [Prolixibacteraceae bacterium]MBT7394369.1 (Fe-S)-binding protein [Prolixibacteraceae bacterium]
MNVDVFIPCFIDQFYPETAVNVISVLEKAGCNVNYNPDQTCCGQPAFNSGYWDETRTLAVKFINDFNGANFIVSPSASCTGFIKNYYGKLFETDKQRLNESNQLSKRIFEFSDFLVNHLNFVDFDSVFNHKVTFHDSCAGLREYGIKNEPRILLQNVKGLELVEMENTDTCCGFGGTFAAKFHSISTAMTEQKVENALKTGADYIVSTEASCLMNIESYIRKKKLPIKTIHLADVLMQEEN